MVPFYSAVVGNFYSALDTWLNQVESWFSKLQRDVIDRGIFTSVADLKRKILRYIRHYQKTAKPFEMEVLRCSKARLPCRGTNVIRKGRVRWLAKEDAIGQALFIAGLFGLAA